MQLRPLTSDEVAEVAAQVLGAPPGPALTALLGKAGGNPLWAVAMLRSLADEGLLRPAGDVVEATTSELPASMSDLVVRRLRHLPKGTLELLQVTAVLGDAVSLRDVAAVARRRPTEVVAQLGAAFDARLLDEVGDRVVFRHQLVHDAIYQHVPAPARRLLHREAAVALMAAGANLLDVADHLVLGAERGDEQAVGWLRDAAREASARAPLVAVELVRRAEALLPGGHRDADLVSAEVVGALLRAGKVAEASARAEAVLARQHAAEVDTPLRLALVGALALQNRAAELIAVAQAALDGAPRLRPFEEVPMLAQQSWALTFTGDHRGGESAARRALVIAEEAGDAASTVWALSALLIAIGRQGRYGEALAHARRAAALAADSHDTEIAAPQAEVLPRPGAVRLRPRRRGTSRVPGGARRRVRLRVVPLRHADRRRSGGVRRRGVGRRGSAADRRRPGRPGEGPPADAVAVARPPGDHRHGDGRSPTPRRSCWRGSSTRWRATSSPTTRELVAFAVAGLKEAEGDRQGAYDVLLRCWRFEAAREDRFYDRCLAPDLVRLALALGDRTSLPRWPSAVAAGRRPGAGGADGAQRGAALPGIGRRRRRTDHRGGRASPARRPSWSSTPAPARTRRGCWPSRAAGRGGGAAGRGARAPRAGGRRGLGGPCPGAAAGASASVLGGEGRGTGRRAAGRASPRPSGRCRCSWPRD